MLRKPKERAHHSFATRILAVLGVSRGWYATLVAVVLSGVFFMPDSVMTASGNASAFASRSTVSNLPFQYQRPFAQIRLAIRGYGQRQSFGLRISHLQEKKSSPESAGAASSAAHGITQGKSFKHK
jgi:hypothetical protein